MNNPFKHHVPKTYEENLRWRAKIHQKVIDDVSCIQALRDACAVDPIFWINGFCWTYDPRRKPYPKLPFILYPFQEEAVNDLVNAIGNNDILIEKSRDMGASWICSLSMMWFWMFKSMQSFLFGSRNEKYVDDTGNPKALFWKLDFTLDHMPAWLKPDGFNNKEHRRYLHLENPSNGSVIDGESTTEYFAQGDRRTAILLDEFALVPNGTSVLGATRDVTKSRIFNSTPDGTANAFYRLRQKPSLSKIRLHWSVHPGKRKGLYATGEGNKLKILDPIHYPKDYHPILDGKLRSPWYDDECERAEGPKEIAQHLDIDYLGSGYQFFGAVAVTEYVSRISRPPLYVGDMEYDPSLGEPRRFRENPKGDLKLWCLLDGDMKPVSDHAIAIGVDISAGTGASNSCLAGYDIATGEKVLELATPYVRPEEFACLAASVARWIRGKSIFKPKVIWESNGPGRQFGSKLIELGYHDVYRKSGGKSKTTDIPGWASTKETKLILLGDYRDAIENSEIINFSKEAVEETLQYVYMPNGGVAHAGSAGKEDPSGANANHGDRAMADALAWKLIREKNKKEPEPEEEPDEPLGSLAWRQKHLVVKKPSNVRLLKDNWYRS